MKNFFIISGLLASICAISIGVSALIVNVAHADITIVPSYSNTSGYLSTNGASITSETDGWWKIIDPNGLYCAFGTGTAGYDFAPLTGVKLFTPDNFADYFAEVIYGHCGAGTGITDWTVDGTWTFAVYPDYNFDTPAEQTTFCQGDGCGEPPPPEPTATSTEATSTVDQSQQNYALSIGLMLAAIWLSIYIFKR